MPYQSSPELTSSPSPLIQKGPQLAVTTEAPSSPWGSAAWVAAPGPRPGAPRRRSAHLSSRDASACDSETRSLPACRCLSSPNCMSCASCDSVNAPSINLTKFQPWSCKGRCRPECARHSPPNSDTHCSCRRTKTHRITLRQASALVLLKCFKANNSSTAVVTPGALIQCHTTNIPIFKPTVHRATPKNTSREPSIRFPHFGSSSPYPNAKTPCQRPPPPFPAPGGHGFGTPRPAGRTEGNDCLPS